MTRLRATLIHFAISVVITSIVVAVMVFIWYPPPLFMVLGGTGLLLLIAGVDVVLGPLLTCIVFKSGKKSLKFDLTMIAFAQFAALAFGLHTIAQVRPAYIAFVKDRFELVRAFDPTPENYAAATDVSYKSPPWFGPKLVGVRFPTNGDENLRMIESALNGGPDIHHLPKYYVDFAASLPSVISKAQSLDVLKKLNPTASAAAQIDTLPQRLGLAAEDLGFIVFRAIRADIAMIVNRRTGQPLEAVVLTPW